MLNGKILCKFPIIRSDQTVLLREVLVHTISNYYIIKPVFKGLSDQRMSSQDGLVSYSWLRYLQFMEPAVQGHFKIILSVMVTDTPIIYQ